jgi:hypothetical protein
MSLRFPDEDATRDTHVELLFEEDRPALQAILASQFPEDFQAWPDERKCIEVLRYVSTSMVIGDHYKVEPVSHILQGGYASCAGFAMCFSELVRCLGIPCRYLGVFGLPGAGSHALAEAHFDGEWHLFDATFGVFFYDQPTYGAGKICSGRAMIVRDERPTMMSPLRHPWRLNYAEELHTPIAPANLEIERHALAYWLEERRLGAFPIAFGNDSQVVFPVRCDLRDKNLLEIGSAGDGWRAFYDINVHNPSTGYFLLGGTTPTSYHLLVIENAGRSELDIEYRPDKGHTSGVRMLGLAALFILDRTETDDAITFRVKTNADFAVALVGSARAFWIDRLRISRRTGTAPVA